MATAAKDSWWTRARTHEELHRLHQQEVQRIIANSDNVKSKDLIVSDVSQSVAEAAQIAHVRPQAAE